MHYLIASPILRERNRRAGQISGKLFQLLFKPFAERKRVRNRSCKPDHDLIVVEPFHLFCRCLHDDGFAHRHLSVAGNRRLAVLLNGQYRCTPEFQAGDPPICSTANRQAQLLVRRGQVDSTCLP
ncbi:hypothetical protein SDC9_190728 [bioreactor metagenome]|uniref:Uncharacterized protein n=1 Tax=bioreactor metagenome TaxID=1076179 RepID=A0A645HYB1_9ZZZZ